MPELPSMKNASCSNQLTCRSRDVRKFSLYANAHDGYIDLILPESLRS